MPDNQTLARFDAAIGRLEAAITSAEAVLRAIQDAANQIGGAPVPEPPQRRPEVREPIERAGHGDDHSAEIIERLQKLQASIDAIDKVARFS